MEVVAIIAMLLWIPCIVGMFAVLPAHRAIIAAFVIGWLFLPTVAYHLPLLPDYTKMSATCIGALVGAVVFDLRAIKQFHFRWFDLPIIVFCICPLCSSISNQLGLWDAMSGMLYQAIIWGVPYFLGRIYFTTFPSLRDLALGVFLGGVIYVPFCLLEMRVGPQLSTWIYGIAGKWTNTVRFGGYRPQVFMQDGLMLSMWMAICSLIGIWMWRVGRIKKVFGVYTSWLVLALATTTILCRSSGALALLAMGLGAIWFSRVTKTRLALFGLLLLAPLYLTIRISGFWDGHEVTELAAFIDADRAASFQFRLNNEDMLVAKALQRPVFGWGGWGRSRVYDEFGRDISITDGLWIQVFGGNGLVGLCALYAAFMIPFLRWIVAFPTGDLFADSIAAPLTVSVVLFAIDCLPNSMENPVFVIVLGSISGVGLGANLVRQTSDSLTSHSSRRPLRTMWPLNTNA